MSWIRGTRLVSGVNTLGTHGSHLECDDFVVRSEVDPEMLLKPVYILTWNVGEHGTSADVRIASVITDRVAVIAQSGPL
jgi:hypothetical protein